MQAKKTTPHYRMTEERAQWEYEQGFSTVTGYLYHLVKATRRDGHKFKIDNVAKFCKERGISRAGFYKAIGKLREAGHVAAETHGSVEIWVDDSAVYESEQLSTKVDTLTVYENRHVSTNVDCESTKVDTVSTNVDKKSTIVDTRSSKVAPDIASSAPSTIIQLSNNSFSDQERGEGEKKASQIELASNSQEGDRNSTEVSKAQGIAPTQKRVAWGSGSDSSAAAPAQNFQSFRPPAIDATSARAKLYANGDFPVYRTSFSDFHPEMIAAVFRSMPELYRLPNGQPNEPKIINYLKNQERKGEADSLLSFWKLAESEMERKQAIATRPVVVETNPHILPLAERQQIAQSIGNAIEEAKQIMRAQSEAKRQQQMQGVAV